MLLILLGLDIAAINLSGIASFWIRCRTALFTEASEDSWNLMEDRLPIWGIGASLRVEAGHVSDGRWTGESEVTEWSKIHLTGGANAVRFDFGQNCRLDRLGFEGVGGIDRAVVEFLSSEGGVEQKDRTLDRTPIPNGGFRYTIPNLSTSARQVRIILPIVSGSSFRLSNFEIFGVASDRPAIFTDPLIEVPQRPYEYLLVIWNIAAFLALLYSGAYRIDRSLEIVDDLCIVVKAVALSTVMVVVILFLHRGYQEATYLGFEFSRLAVIMGAAMAVLFLTLNRFVIDLVHLYFLKRGVGIRKVVIVGAGPEGQRIVERLQTHYWLAYEPVAFVDDNKAVQGSEVVNLPVLGGTHQLGTIAHSLGTDEVIVALPNSSPKAVRDIVGRCANERLRFRILPDLFEVISSQVQVGALDGVPVLDIDDHYLGSWDRFLKRGIDLFGGALIIALMSPVLLIFGVMIRLTSRGAAIFVQERIGENGRTFRCYKFRSMTVTSAEDEAQGRGRQFKIAISGGVEGGKLVDTSRVTWVGRILRRFSIDELPQLFNVFKGDMSLVGPRPPIPYEIRHYNCWHLERLKGKPGMTGLWQVSGRAELPFEEMVKLDLYYLKQWSLWLDFKILLKTIPAVLGGRGAR